MEIFRSWLADMDTEALIQYFQSLGETMNMLRDTPLSNYTIRTFMEVQNELGLDNLMFQLTYETLTQRQLSPDQMMAMASIMDGKSKE